MAEEREGLSRTAYQRDPLSVRYDDMAGKLLGRAISARPSWVTMTVARPGPVGPKTREWLRSHGILLDVIDDGGLTTYERAFQRSLYWNAKRLGISVTRFDNPRAALQRDWGAVTPKGRLIAIRITEVALAWKAVNRKPAGEQWSRRGSGQQSGGVGSPKRRFA